VRRGGHHRSEQRGDARALQAWHVASEFGGGGGFLLLLGIFGAGGFSRAIPSWVAWSALVRGICGFTPYSFYADLLVWLWAAVAGVVLCIRKVEPMPTGEALPVASARV
jgi:hypothetical protein